MRSLATIAAFAPASVRPEQIRAHRVGARESPRSARRDLRCGSQSKHRENGPADRARREPPRPERGPLRALSTAFCSLAGWAAPLISLNFNWPERIAICRSHAAARRVAPLRGRRARACGPSTPAWFRGLFPRATRCRPAWPDPAPARSLARGRLDQYLGGRALQAHLHVINDQ